MPNVTLLDTLEQQAVPAVVDRRSIHMLLEEQWHVARDNYWRLLLRVLRSSAPGVSKVVLAESLTRVATDYDDLAFLYRALDDAETRDSAGVAIVFVARFVAAEIANIENAVTWMRFAAVGAQRVEPIRGSLWNLLSAIWREKKVIEPSAQREMAKASRDYVRAALEQNSPLYGLPLVIDTLSIDTRDNGELLRSILESTCRHPEKDDAVHEMLRRIDDLFPDLHLVSALYAHATHVEVADELLERRWFTEWSAEWEAAQQEKRKPALPSRERSTRYADLQWTLNEHARTFVEAAPILAAGVVADALQAREELEQNPKLITLTVAGREFAVAARPPTEISNERGLVAHLSHELLSVLAHAERNLADDMLRVLIARRATTAFWSLLIERAAYEEPLRDIALDLIKRDDALRLFSHAAATLIRAWGEHMPASLRTDLSVRVSRFESDELEYVRRRLEAALAPAAPVIAEDDDARIDAATAADMDADDVWFASHFKLTPEERAEPANQQLRAANRSASAAEQRLQSALNLKDFDQRTETSAAIDALKELRRLVDSERAHVGFVVTGWCTLARLASVLILSGERTTACDVLFEAAKRRDSIPWQGDGSFGDLLNAGQAIPRAESVRGLSALASRSQSDHAFGEIERLARDLEPAVRFQVAWHAHELVELDPDRIWAIVSNLMEDASAGVAAAMVRRLGAYFVKDRAKAIDLTGRLLARMSGPTQTERDARTEALLQLAWYHLAQGNESAGRAIDRVIADIAANTAGIERLLHGYRRWLTLEEDDEPAATAARERTLQLFTRIGMASRDALRAATGGKDPNAQQRSERDPHAVVLEYLAYQLYFASGAFGDDDEKPSPEAMGRFFEATKMLLVGIGTAGSIAAADKVLDTLEHFYMLSRENHVVATNDVLAIFVQVAESMVAAGAATQYWLLDPVEKVLRRCVAERDPSLRDERMLGTWARILDMLLERGWPQAFRLAADLDISR